MFKVVKVLNNNGILAYDMNTRREVIFLGDGVPVFKAQLEEKVKVPHSFAPASCNRQRAAAIGVLAFSYAKMGKMEKAEEHMPDYLRLSQAERERKEEMERGTTN